MTLVTSKWLDQAEEMLSCGNQFSAAQLNSILFGLRVRTLLAKCANVLSEDYDSDATTILGLYERVKCGEVISEIVLLRGLALLELKEKACNISINDNVLDAGEKSFIFASGFWTMSGGNLYIAVAGILDTDKVFVQLTDLNGTESITTAKANNGSSRIDLTFAGTPANANTKAQWFVIR